jgi:hypothetical protein
MIYSAELGRYMPKRLKTNKFLSRKFCDSTNSNPVSLYVQETSIHTKEKGRCVTNYQIHIYDTRTGS